MSFMPSPSKKIIALMASSIIVIGAIGVNKFWPKPSAESLVAPSYDTANPGTSMAQTGINGTEFLQAFVPSTAATSTDDTPDTISRNISREIFASVSYLENSGGLNDASMDALVNNALGQIQNAFTYKQYSADKMVYLNEDKASIKAYAEAFAVLQVNMILEMQRKVGAIQGNVGVLRDIYAKQALNLYSIKVPKSIAVDHLQVVNDFSRVASALDAIVHEKEDPLKVPLAIRVYQDAQTSQTLSLMHIASFIKSNGIIFTSGEIGKYWEAFQ